MIDTTAVSDLERITIRLAALRAAKLTPTSVSLSRARWSQIRSDFAAQSDRREGGRVSGIEVFGVKVRIHPGILEDFISYDGGMEPVR